jgi:hypothetical protein
MDIQNIDISKIRDGEYIGSFSYSGFEYKVKTIVGFPYPGLIKGIGLESGHHPVIRLLGQEAEHKSGRQCFSYRN